MGIAATCWKHMALRTKRPSVQGPLSCASSPLFPRTDDPHPAPGNAHRNRTRPLAQQSPCRAGYSVALPRKPYRSWPSFLFCLACPFCSARPGRARRDTLVTMVRYSLSPSPRHTTGIPPAGGLPRSWLVAMVSTTLRMCVCVCASARVCAPYSWRCSGNGGSRGREAIGCRRSH